MEEIDLIEKVKDSFFQAKQVLEKFKTEDGEKLKNLKTKVGELKSYLDALINLYHFIKPLYVSLSKKEEKSQIEIYQKDTSFYNEFDRLYEILAKIVPLYNQTRNYLTKKPYSIEKYKLNFNNQELAKGWTKNREKTERAIVLRKGEKYFLGLILDTAFLENIKETESDEAYTKMVYHQAADPGKDIQNLMVIQGKTVRKTGGKEYITDVNQPERRKKMIAFIEREGLSQQDKVNFKLEELKEKYLPNEINRIRISKSYKTTSLRYDKSDLTKFIDYYKKRLDYWEYEFSLKESSAYSSFEEFTSHINSQAYSINFDLKISKEYIHNCINDEKLLLFQISSKDFSANSKGNPNLNTLYFLNLFSDENMEDLVYKLNAGAELFYRKVDQNFKPTIHQKDIPILRRTYEENGQIKSVPSKVYQELKEFYADKIKEADLSKESQRLKPLVKRSEFIYNITKDKRYTKERYSFHLSTSLNFGKKFPKFNDKVNQYLKKHPAVNIIGIDRGERHLAYYTVINRQGEIIKNDKGEYLQGSLNNPNGQIDYQDLLDKREKERDKARRSWKTIEKIKDLKEGYVSQVVHKITKLMVEHNAIVVFEDLNWGFKKGRFKVEKQVYQKLEKALLDKLNYLVFKDRVPREVGGVLKALQLTPQIKSYKDMKSQQGFVFYVPAYHTSKICPKTGFVNLLYPKHETVKKSQEFFGRFDKIIYNQEKKYFEFHLDYKEFPKIKSLGNKTKWVICTYKDRLENSQNSQKNNQWETKSVNLTDEFKNLFDNMKISYSSSKCVKEEIANKSDSSFFENLIKLLRLTLHVRNSKIGSDEDWIISSVQDDEGNIFDSRDHENDLFVPQNADANGAYHIALKGLWYLKHIQKRGEFPKKSITNQQWYNFAQQKEYKK